MMTSSATSFHHQLLYMIEHRWALDQIKPIVETYGLYNVTDGKKNGLLHYAAEYDNVQVARYLIESGSKIDARNVFGQTPLTAAVLKPNWDLVEVLIRAGANMCIGQERGRSALQLVCTRKFVSKETFRLFWERLRSDCSNDQEEIATRLLDAGWPLPIIIQLDARLMKILLERGYAARFNIDAVENNDEGLTALHVAVRNGDVENVKLLLEYNAKVDVKDSSRRTPLAYVLTSTFNETFKNES